MRTFGTLPGGQTASLHTLTNANGLSAEVTSYGGIITRLLTPDRDGRMADVVLGFNTLEQYVADTPFFGALIGRFGNRIAHGRFTLDGKVYDLPAKNNAPAGIPCHLHGGAFGFDKVNWAVEPATKDGVNGLKLTYVSKDGEEGYPGTLTATVHYWLTDANELRVDYHAVTDKPTPVNLTQHTYFNLRGEGTGDILGHVLQINASKFTPSNAGQIPIGAIVPVKGTPFDFTRPKAIGADIGASDEQLACAGGYDHNFVIDRAGPGLVLAATVHEPVTRRYMEVFTEEPGVQFYCGNFLDGHHMGKSGRAYGHRSGFCLETQNFPDAPNHANFPNSILRPGEVYRTSTVYRFSTR
jgi:aldose 1-epimerase